MEIAKGAGQQAQDFPDFSAEKAFVRNTCTYFGKQVKEQKSFSLSGFFTYLRSSNATELAKRAITGDDEAIEALRWYSKTDIEKIDASQLQKGSFDGAMASASLAIAYLRARNSEPRQAIESLYQKLAQQRSPQLAGAAPLTAERKAAELAADGQRAQALAAAFLAPPDNPSECLIDEQFIQNMKPGTLMPIPKDVDKQHRRTIAVIEQRARPGEGSVGGFLGKDESLQEVLLKDWETVKKLGTSHLALADRLKEIVNLAKEHPDELIPITFGQPPQELQVMYARSKTDSLDIFIEGSEDIDGSKVPNFEGNECRIINRKTGVIVVWTSTIDAYIRRYGFYEGGGDSNQYRLDPVKLCSLFTGEPVADIQKRL